MDKEQITVESELDPSVDGGCAVDMTDTPKSVADQTVLSSEMTNDTAKEPMAEPLVKPFAESRAETLAVPSAEASPITRTETPGEGDIEGFDLTNEDEPTPEKPLSDAMQSAIRQSVECAVSTAVDAAVSMAVAQAVSAAMASAVTDLTAQISAQMSAKAEQNLMEHIRAMGQRPTENGVRDTAGVRMHPAVDHLTRKDRATLAARAARGETVRL